MTETYTVITAIRRPAADIAMVRTDLSGLQLALKGAATISPFHKES